MTHQRRSLTRFLALCCLLLLSCSPLASQSPDRGFGEKSFVGAFDQRDQFIAALEWSVDKQTEYVWPFESIKPAGYAQVRLLIDQMPRAWSERGNTRGSIPLSAARSLIVNGNKLPRPQRGSSREEYRVSLVDGRLRFSLNVPSGFKLDPQNAVIRIRLYRTE